jgi:predicted small secreted protein
MKKLLCLVAVAALLAGCNTVSGMGRDIQKAGETIEGAASRKR